MFPMGYINEHEDLYSLDYLEFREVLQDVIKKVFVGWSVSFADTLMEDDRYILEMPYTVRVVPGTPDEYVLMEEPDRNVTENLYEFRSCPSVQKSPRSKNFDPIFDYNCVHYKKCELAKNVDPSYFQGYKVCLSDLLLNKTVPRLYRLKSKTPQKLLGIHLQGLPTVELFNFVKNDLEYFKYCEIFEQVLILRDKLELAIKCIYFKTASKDCKNIIFNFEPFGTVRDTKHLLVEKKDIFRVYGQMHILLTATGPQEITGEVQVV